MWNSLLVSPAVLGALFVGSTGAIAAESQSTQTPAIAQSEQSSPLLAQATGEVLQQIGEYSQEGRGSASSGQVTSVSQLS
ncbi:MAG: hypothetical protein D6680_14745, partial [Cyanobacteria bacterium J007]